MSTLSFVSPITNPFGFSEGQIYLDAVFGDIDNDGDIGLSGGLTFGDLSFSGNSIAFNGETLAVLTGVNTTTLTQSNFVSV